MVIRQEQLVPNSAAKREADHTHVAVGLCSAANGPELPDHACLQKQLTTFEIPRFLNARFHINRRHKAISRREIVVTSECKRWCQAQIGTVNTVFVFSVEHGKPETAEATEIQEIEWCLAGDFHRRANTFKCLLRSEKLGGVLE